MLHPSCPSCRHDETTCLPFSFRPEYSVWWFRCPRCSQKWSVPKQASKAASAEGHRVRAYLASRLGHARSLPESFKRCTFFGAGALLGWLLAGSTGLLEKEYADRAEFIPASTVVHDDVASSQLVTVRKARVTRGRPVPLRMTRPTARPMTRPSVPSRGVSTSPDARTRRSSSVTAAWTRSAVRCIGAKCTPSPGRVYRYPPRRLELPSDPVLAKKPAPKKPANAGSRNGTSKGQRQRGVVTYGV